MFVVVALVSVLYLIINPTKGEKFTEFYILGPGGKAGDYPTNLTAGESAELIIGLVNHEDTTISYQLMVQFRGEILKNETYNLKNGEKKEIPFNFQLNQSVNGGKLEFTLYKIPNNQYPYRYLELLVNVA